MNITAALSVSTSGMQTQTDRISAAAQRIANAGAPDQNTDLASDLLDVMGAETAFAANATAFETGADMWDMLMKVVRD